MNKQTADARRNILAIVPIQPRPISRLSHAILLSGQRMHAVRPHRSVSHQQAHRSWTRLQTRAGRLLSTDHSSSTGAAINEKCQFSAPYSAPLTFCAWKNPHAGATLKISSQSWTPFPSYKRTNIHRDRHTHEQNYYTTSHFARPVGPTCHPPQPSTLTSNPLPSTPPSTLLALKSVNFLTPYSQPPTFSPTSHPGAPCSYPENLEKIVLLILESWADKQTNTQTDTQSALYIYRNVGWVSEQRFNVPLDTL